MTLLLTAAAAGEGFFSTAQKRKSGGSARRFPVIITFVFLCQWTFGQDAVQATKDQLIWKIAPEMTAGMLKLNEAFDAFDVVYEAMKTIQDGKRPDIEQLEADDWQPLVDACQEATYDIRRARFATDFNTASYSIAPEQFKCENKAWIVTTLNLYKDTIAASTFAAKRDIAKLDQSLEHADKLVAAVNECKKIYEKVLSLPIYQELFLWDWYALENAVKPAVGEYKSELKKHRDKYQKEVDRAERHWSALSNNIALIEDCDKPKPEPLKPVYDFYSGTFGNRKFEIKLKRLGNYYMSEGWVRKYGQAGYSHWNIRTLIENKNVLEIYTVLTHTDGTTSSEQLKGSFSADKKKITLTYVRPKYAGTVQVSKK